MKNIKFIFAVFVAIIFVVTTTVSCTREKSNKVDPEKIVRLDNAVMRYPKVDSAQRALMLDSLRPEFTALMEVLEMPETSDSTVMVWALSYPVAVFWPMADSVFTDLSVYEQDLGIILERARQYGLDLPKRRYATVEWGRSESIVFNDSIMLIALNHYLGANHRAYSNWPRYRTVLKRPDMLPYDMAEALVATAYPFNPDGKERPMVLNRLLYQGALTVAKMKLVPDATLENSLGFTASQLSDLSANQQLIWQKLVAEKMLYSTDEDLMDRLFALLPYSTPISPAAPGRAVNYIGYQMVEQYLERNPGTSLSVLLSPEFYMSPGAMQKIGYAP